MFRMLMFAVRSFFQRRLFRDHGIAFRQWLKGFLLTLVLLLVLGYFLSPLTGTVVASLVGGAAQPYLFKDIKYA